MLRHEAPEMAALQAALTQAQAEAAQAKDAALRAKAEMENVRRRSAQDAEKARKFALEKFAKALLPVIDNLERALSAQSDDVSAITEGVELTLKSFVETVEKFDIEQVNPAQGEAFSPEVHQAISMVPMPEQEPNTIIAVMQKGYLLNGRLIRPAMVTVAAVFLAKRGEIKHFFLATS